MRTQCKLSGYVWNFQLVWRAFPYRPSELAVTMAARIWIDERFFFRRDKPPPPGGMAKVVAKTACRDSPDSPFTQYGAKHSFLGEAFTQSRVCDIYMRQVLLILIFSVDFWAPESACLEFCSISNGDSDYDNAISLWVRLIQDARGPLDMLVGFLKIFYCFYIHCIYLSFCNIY